MSGNPRARNEGARRLRSGGWSSEQISSACGVTRTTADRWRRGEKIPGADARVRLSRAPFRIPRASWDKKPGGDAGPAVARQVARKPAASPLLAQALLENVDTTTQLRGQVKRYLEMLADKETSADTAARLERGLTAVVNALVKLEGTQITESTIVRHPAHRRVMAAVLSALDPYPEALRAVADVLHARGA